MPLAQDSGSNSILQILNLFRPPGGSTITDSGSTTTTSVDSNTVNTTIQQLLDGTSGLASLSQGEKSSGVYNSTTKQLLTNDLLSRAAGVASSLNKTVTTTPSVKSVNPSSQLSPGSTIATGLAGSLASSLLGPTIKGLSKKLGTDDLGNKLAESILGKPTSTISGGDVGAGNVGDIPTSSGAAFDFQGGNDGTNSFLTSSGLSVPFAQATGPDLGSVAESTVGDVASDASDASAAVDTGSEAASETGDIADAGSDAGDIFGGLFADGGQVPYRAANNMAGAVLNPGTKKNMPASMQDTGTGNRYANGGVVQSGARTVGTPSDVEATRIVESPSNSISNNQTTGSGASVDTGTSASNSTGTNANNSGLNSNNLGMIGSLASIGLSSNPIGLALGLIGLATNTTLGHSPIGALAAALGIGNNSSTGADSETSADNSSVSVGEPSTETDSVAEAAEASAESAGESDSSSEGSSSADSDGASSGDSDGGSGDGGGDGGGFNNGGKIPGKDTQGKDNINIHVSGGEYVIPEDVVSKLGVDYFDKLKAAFHTPINTQ